MSLRYRLLMVLLAATVLTSLTATGVTYYWARHEIDELLDYQLKQQALALRDKAYLLGSIAVVEPDPEQHVVIQLWDRRGELRYLSHRGVDLARPGRYGYADIRGDTRDWRAYATQLGPWIVQLAQPLQIRRDIAANAAWRILLPTLAVLPLLVVLVWWIVGRVLAPITNLAAALGQRRSNALESLPTAGLPQEIELMVSALNSLIARLREVLDQQQAFMADAAHELRTPLTAVSLQAELLARAESPADAAEALVELQHGVARSAKLVERLLTLARLDAASGRDAAAPTDLSALLQRALAERQVLARTRGLDLRAEVEPAVIVDGYANQLQSLVENLLDNALRHTPQGGRITVSLTPRRREICLVVQDTGPGIPVHERERVFDRFYRVPGTQVAGSGLGLAIVQRVVQLHGGSIEIADAPGGGAAITVRLPAERVARIQPATETVPSASS
jgi:two-component system, OmpR family, sensor kinase